jgi:hypothetical protein
MEPKELYENLFGAKMYTNSYEQFKKDYGTEQGIAELHGQLLGIKAYTGDLRTFKSDYFTPVKKKDSAFDWQTGTIDSSKLSFSQTPARIAEKGSDVTTGEGIQIDWGTGEVKKSAFERNAESVYQLTTTDSTNQSFQEETQPIGGEAQDVTFGQAGMALVEGVNKGFYEQAIGGTLKGAGELITKGHNKLFGDNAKVDESWLYQAGEAVQSMFKEDGVAEPTSDPALLNSDIGQIGAGLGQMSAMILTGGASSGAAAMSGVAKSTPILKVAAQSLFSRPAMMGTMQIVGDGSDKIREEKSVVDQMDRDGYVKLNIEMGMDEKAAGQKYDKLKSTSADDLISEMLPTWFMEGSTEGLMVGEWFKRFNKATGGSFGKVFMEKAKDVGIGTFEGAAQEALQQWMDNATAKEVYDYTLKTTEGMAQSAKIGGAVQFILETMSAALGVKNRNTSGDDKAFIEKAQEEIENRKELLAKNLDNALIETVKMEDVKAELAKKVEAGEITQAEAEVQASEILAKKAAIEKTPESQKTNPDVVETMVEKTKVDEEISAKKEEIKTVDPAFQQDAKNEIAALEKKSAELSLQVAEKAGVTPDEKAVKLLEPKEESVSQAGPAKEGKVLEGSATAEPVAQEPVNPESLQPGTTYYNSENDRNYVFTGVNESGMFVFEKIPKKGEVLMTTTVEAFKDSNFTKKLFDSNPEPQKAEATSWPITQEQPVQEGPIAPTAPIQEPPPPIDDADVNPTSSGVKKRVLTERAYEGTVRDEVKVFLKEKGLTRTVVSQEQRSSDAEDFIGSFGEDAAVEAVKAGDVRGAMAASVLARLIKNVDDQMANTDPSDTEAINALAKKQADLIELLGNEAFFGGEYNSQLAYEYSNSDIGYNFAAKKSEYIKQFGQIPPEVEAKFAELDAQLRELSTKLAEAERRAAEAADAATIESIRNEANRNSGKSKTEIASAAKEIAKKIRRGRLSKPGVFSAASPASLVWDAAIEIAATTVEAGGTIAQAIANGIEHIRNSEWYRGISASMQAEAEDGFSDFLTTQEEAAGKLKVPKSLIRDLVGSGINNIDDLVDAVRNELGLTEESDRDIRDAITDYGKTINMTKDDISVEVRKLRRVGRLISALEDVADKKRPLRSGLQRDKMDAEERSLQKELREAMKDLPMDDETLASEQKTALDAAKTRIKNQIEDIEREIERMELIKRSPKQVQEDTELADLKKQRDDLKRQRDELLKDEEYEYQKRLAATKKRTEASIKELERRISEKDFAPKKPKPLVEDTELTALRAEKLRIKEEYDKEFYKQEIANRTLRQRIIDRIWDAWGITRVLSATAEFSFVFIQGGMQTIAHPKNAVNAFKMALKAFSSEKKTEEFIRNIKAQDFYPDMKNSKLALTETHSQLKAREELFYSDWSDWVWNTIGSPFKLIGETTHEKWKALNPFKAFERAAVGYLDTMRVLRYMDGVESLKIQGKTFQSHPQDYKDVADVINTMTGRASLGKLEQLSQPLTRIFFSPRNWASQVKTATPYAFYYFGKLTPTARKLALMDFSKFVGTMTAMVMLFAANLNDDDDDETGVEFDPRSSDFMKIKIGDLRIDPWRGMQQQIVLTARLIMDILYDVSPSISAGGFKNNKGQVVPLGTRFKSQTKKDVMLQMAINKLAPSAHIMERYFSAERGKDNTMKDKYGNEYTLQQDVKDSLSPIYWSTISDLSSDGVDAMDGILMFVSFFGFGVNQYQAKREKDKK